MITPAWERESPPPRRSQPFASALSAGLVDVPVVIGSMGQECDLAPGQNVQGLTMAQWQGVLEGSVAAWDDPSFASDIWNAYLPDSSIATQVRGRTTYRLAWCVPRRSNPTVLPPPPPPPSWPPSSAARLRRLQHRLRHPLRQRRSGAAGRGVARPPRRHVPVRGPVAAQPAHPARRWLQLDAGVPHV